MAGRLVLVAIAILVGSGLTFGVVTILSADSHRQEAQLAERGAIVIGRVTGSFPTEHGTIEYTYVVDGHTYTGGGRVSGSNPRPEQLRPGDNIRIVYDPKAAHVSCACSPQDDLANERRDNLGLALFGGFIAGALVFLASARAAASARKR
jgi:hypothetical protein